MELWFIFAFLSIFAIAGSELSQKISLTQKANISAITNNFFVWSMQGIGGLILAILLNQTTINLDLFSMLRLGMVALVYFLGGTFFYTSYKANSPSISIILGSVSVVVSTTLGIIFLAESTMPVKFLGIFLILLSIIIINLQKTEKFNKYNLFALMGGLCYGVAYTLDKSLVANVSPALYVSLMCISVAVVSLTLKSKQIISEARLLKKQNYYPMISSAFFGTLFNFFTFMSYSKGGNVGSIDALNNSSIFIVILLEIVILKDKSNLFKKVVCAVIALSGIFLLSRIK